ncbi:LADA_0E11760g1_1 [Lachancea dasiensis]|uniref:LADA_0E11760g1_1 n=1 Tax=Lachancea dasiensis TaxID=1072105 RepID=A0A1G4JES1_9SACH|nr:LADA_0E11760g1_1 [Lachancea dasiensis]
MNSVSLAGILQYFLIFLQFATADLIVTRPEGGAEWSIPPNSHSLQIQVAWQDVGRQPDLDTVSQYVFTLCTGTNDKIQAVATLDTVAAGDVGGYQHTVSIDSSLGSSGMYFIQIVAVSSEWVTIHYSDRFTIRGMQGNLPALAVNNAQGPHPETMKIGPDGAPPPINSASFTIPYTLQTGSYRFAPMQTQPGTSVSATAWSRQNPSSSCTFFTALTNKPEWHTTITAGWDYTIQTRVNDIHPRPMPQHNGGWYKPDKKITLTARKVNRFNY